MIRQDLLLKTYHLHVSEECMLEPLYINAGFSIAREVPFLTDRKTLPYVSRLLSLTL